MQRKTHYLLLALSVPWGVFCHVGAAQTASPSRTQPLVHAKFVSLDQHHLNVTIDGKPRTYPRRSMKQWRIHKGFLQVKLAGDTTLLIKLDGPTRKNTVWETVPAPPSTTSDQSRAAGSTMESDARIRRAGRFHLKQVQRVQRSYQKAKESHKRRMHAWLSLMDRARQASVQSSVINNAAVFETRQLAGKIDKILVIQRKHLARLEQLALQIAGSGTDLNLVKQFNLIRDKTMQLKEEIFAAERDLEQNISMNASIIQAEMQSSQ